MEEQERLDKLLRDYVELHLKTDWPKSPKEDHISIDKAPYLVLWDEIQGWLGHEHLNMADVRLNIENDPERIAYAVGVHVGVLMANLDQLVSEEGLNSTESVLKQVRDIFIKEKVV